MKTVMALVHLLHSVMHYAFCLAGAEGSEKDYMQRCIEAADSYLAVLVKKVRLMSTGSCSATEV